MRRALTDHEVQLLERAGYRVLEDGRVWDDFEGHTVSPGAALTTARFAAEREERGTR